MSNRINTGRAFLFAALSWPLPSLAEPPCVGDLVNTPFPGAVDVVRRSVDVASARVAGLWQEGRIEGFAYQVFSNRTGMIADDLVRPNWRIEVFCDAPDSTCRQDAMGSPPDEATAVAESLALCMIGEPLEASDLIVPELALEAIAPSSIGEPEAAEAPEEALPDIAATIVQTMLPSCGTPIPTDENEQVLQLQTILQQIGFDPGPVDGLLGPLTIAAVIEAIGSEATGLSTHASLTAVREAHCEN